MSSMNRQYVLASRPFGMIEDSNFEYREVPLPDLEAGQVLVRNRYLSLDPAMRGWMNDMESYLPPVKIGEVMRGTTIGEVVASEAPHLQKGQYVMGMGGWQDFYVTSPGAVAPVPSEPFPLPWYLSVLGVTGLTAYFGLMVVGQPKPGDTVVVSTAAGAVGSIVCQLAKVHGCTVIGIAGSDEKCTWLKESLGIDAAINYKSKGWASKLRRSLKNGIDLYFDNVGGELLNTCLGLINTHARVVICGAISQYNATEMPTGPANYLRLLTRRARMEGFVLTDYLDRRMEGVMALAPLLLQGKLVHKEEIVPGLKNAPVAIHKLFNGSNTGKLIISLLEDDS